MYRSSYLHLRSVERVPNASHALVYTGHRLAQLLVLLARAISQYLCFFPHALVLQVLYADGPRSAVEVVCDNDGVLSWPSADGDFDLWVVAGKGWERGFYEGIHASRGGPPVAVVKAERLAGEDEGADAILGCC